MKYKEMLEAAKQKGVAGEKVMWQSVDDIDNLLCVIKKHDEQAYWDFIMATYGTLYNNHFATEDFAAWFVEQMHSTQKDGKELKGQYWSCQQVQDAVKQMSLTVPSDVTKYDLWVAMNAAKHDFGRKFTDEEVLKIGWLFYFDDEDFKTHDKVFRYMEMTRE
jgi:hypothetical protein